jgi:hypothetical protein
MTIYIGVDQSLAATGIAVTQRPVFCPTFGIEVLHVSCTPTKAAPKSAKLSKAECDGERVDAVAQALVVAYRLADDKRGCGERIIIGIEAHSGSKSALAAKCTGLACGTVRGVCYALGIEPVIVTAREAKKALAGSSWASKDDNVSYALNRFGPIVKRAAGTKRDRNAKAQEAIADALAIATALMRAHP